MATSSSLVCTVATKALLLWIGFYVLLLHGFVVWKWDTVSIALDPPPHSWNSVGRNGGTAAIAASSADKEEQRRERRATRKEQLRQQRQAARRQERKQRAAAAAREERKAAFLQRLGAARDEERQEKKTAALQAALQERQAQRVIRQEKAVQQAAESRAARQVAYEQVLMEKQVTRAARQEARRLERLDKARAALAAEKAAQRAAVRQSKRAEAIRQAAENSTLQQVLLQQEELRMAIHAQDEMIAKEELYMQALTTRLQRVSEASARVQENQQVLQQKIQQVMATKIPKNADEVISLSTTGGSAPHRLGPLVEWLQKQVPVVGVVENDENERARTIRKNNASDLILLHPTLHDLEDQFAYMDSVLQEQIQHAASVNWTLIHAVLRREYPSKKSSSSSGSNHLAYCSNAREVMLAQMQQESLTANSHGDAGQPGRPEFIMSSSNLAQRLEAVAILKNYTTLDQSVDVPIYFRETYENIFAKLDDAMNIWLERVTEAFHEYEMGLGNTESSSSQVKSVGGGAGGCVSLDQVDVLLGDGLDALYRNQDLRQALFHTMSRLDMNASAIILDAMLPGHDSDMQQRLRDGHKDGDDHDCDDGTIGTLSLRELLDRPVTHEMAKWINFLLDRISGHVDTLDRYLDAKIPAGIDVGEYIVHRLLELAGTYGNRNVMAYIGGKKR